MKIFTGKVTSKKMDKTATIAVERTFVHPVYKKRIKRSRKYQVHDEVGANIGEMVRFVASKPYSKTKKWEIIEVIDNKKSARTERSKKSAKSVDKQKDKKAKKQKE